MQLQKFTVKDIIFIAILSAVLLLAGGLVMPLVMSVTLFGIRNMVSALLYSIFVILGLMKVRKIGTLTLIGLFHGSVLLLMSPVMFFNMFIGAILSELITYLIYKSYEKDKSKILATTLFIPLTLPTTFVFTMLIHGMTAAEVVEKPLISAGICVATVILSYIGTRIGYKLGKELQKAGKL